MNITNFDLEKWYVKYEFLSKYNLSTSGIRPLKLRDLGVELDKNLTLSYSPATGDTNLREKLALDKKNVLTEEVLVTNGAIEALFLIQMVLGEKNKKIITVSPTYPALYNIFSDLGCDIKEWKLVFENNFRPDFNTLERLIIEHKAEILIINFPNNPTGINLTDEEFQNLIKIAKKYNLLIISDEVYTELNPNEKHHLYEAYKKSVVINSFSKSYGLAGIRIGYMIANEKIIQKCMNLRHYSTICNNILGEQIALQALEKKQEIFELNQKLMLENREITFKVLEKLKSKNLIDYILPDVGVMVLVKLNNDIDAEAFCTEFEKQESILLLPANKYREDYKNFFRLGFGINSAELIYCLDKLTDFF